MLLWPALEVQQALDRLQQRVFLTGLAVLGCEAQTCHFAGTPKHPEQGYSDVQGVLAARTLQVLLKVERYFRACKKVLECW